MLRAVLNNSSSAKTEEIENFIDSLSSLEALNDKIAEAEEYTKGITRRAVSPYCKRRFRRQKR